MAERVTVSDMMDAREARAQAQRALLALETDSPVMAWACFAALGLALVFFTLFVLSDKDRFQGTAVAREGLWEQLCLAAMYVPLLLDAIVHLISAP